VIVVGLATYAALTLAYRAIVPEDADAKLRLLVGVTYAEAVRELGPPDREGPDGRGGLVIVYDEVGVVDSRFAESQFRIYFDEWARIYRVERD
jgi:hypothetical protein